LKPIVEDILDDIKVTSWKWLLPQKRRVCVFVM